MFSVSYGYLLGIFSVISAHISTILHAKKVNDFKGLQIFARVYRFSFLTKKVGNSAYEVG